MSKLQDLLDALCPNGVEYKQLKDVVDVCRGRRLTKSQLSDGAPYEVYHGSKDTLLGHYTESNVPGNTVIVVNTGGIGGVKYLDKDFWCSDGSFFLSHNAIINNKFLYYVLIGYEEFFASQRRVGGVPTIDRSVVENVTIPVPPLPVQEEVVRILDTFTTLEAELEAELSARRKQYEFYREQLLTFRLPASSQNADEGALSALQTDRQTDRQTALRFLLSTLCPNGVKFVNIGDVAEVGTGSSNGNEAIDNGEYPFFVRSQTVKAKNEYEYDEEAIIIPGEGGIGEIFHYVNGKYALHQRVYRIHFTNDAINVKFILHYMKAHFKAFILQKAVSSTVTSIRKPMVEGFLIPVPPMQVQQYIVEILDKFDALAHDIEIGLPAEIAARRKQYEYYREKLLTFKVA